MRKIDRRTFFKSTSALVAATIPASMYVPRLTHAAKRPNVVLITSEDTGPHLSCYGDPYARTPHLDALAREGVRFTNAYVTQAGCSPSRASIFTGLYPSQNGQIGLATHNMHLYHEDVPNLFRSLKQAGCRTGVIGKIHVNPESAFPLDYEDKLGGFQQRDVRKEAASAVTFMNDTGQPFLLMVNYKDTHRPFIRQQAGLPEKPLEANEVEPLPHFGIRTPTLQEQTADYYNCINRLDAGIGMLMDALETCGHHEDTIVIYLGDHGADMLRGKRTCYEGGIKIPLIMRWPKGIRPGQVRHELVSIIDLMPTLLEICGAESVENLPGRSLSSIFKGEYVAGWRNHLYSEYHLHSGHNFYPQRAIRNLRFKLIMNLMHGQLNPGYAFTNDRFFKPGEIERQLESSPQYLKDVYNTIRISPEFELYDLYADPHEFHNLAEYADYQHILRQLQQELLNYRRQLK
ncbi:sulfatase, partial [candidate division KSB1 bacterium]|nr:sulfatase [candidate division KSB1 bacterium]